MAPYKEGRRKDAARASCAKRNRSCAYLGEDQGKEQ